LQQQQQQVEDKSVAELLLSLLVNSEIWQRQFFRSSRNNIKQLHSLLEGAGHPRSLLA
jgi:hypothetical protein